MHDTKDSKTMQERGKEDQKQLNILYLYKSEAQNYITSSRVPSRAEPDTVKATNCLMKEVATNPP